MATVASPGRVDPPVAHRSTAAALARRWLRKLAFAFAVAVIVSPAILVFLWMLSLSLKNELANSTYPPIFLSSPSCSSASRRAYCARTLTSFDAPVVM